MENKIRIRVWDKEKHLMYYDLPLHLLISWFSRLARLNDIFKLPGYTFMRFTGLFDYNSRRIYEYDIIELDGIPYIVTWNISTGCWNAEEITGLDKRPLSRCLEEGKCVIEGNKFQPPRWLKVT